MSYVVQNEQRRLFFSKVKASPLKERTLPTLELLAVQLALKCFLTIFNDGLMKDVSFSDINFFMLFIWFILFFSFISANNYFLVNVVVGIIR